MNSNETWNTQRLIRSMAVIRQTTYPPPFNASWDYRLFSPCSMSKIMNHDDVIKWKHFPRYWPFVQGIHRGQRPVARSFDVFLDLRLNKRLSKQSWGWWFETPSCLLWRHCNDWCILLCLGFITFHRIIVNLSPASKGTNPPALVAWNSWHVSKNHSNKYEYGWRYVVVCCFSHRFTYANRNKIQHILYP